MTRKDYGNNRAQADTPGPLSASDTGVCCRCQSRGHTAESERPLHLIRLSLVSSRFKQSPGLDVTVRSGRSWEQSPFQTKQLYSWLEFAGFATLIDRTPVSLYADTCGSRQVVSQIAVVQLLTSIDNVPTWAPSAQLSFEEKMSCRKVSRSGAVDSELLAVNAMTWKARVKVARRDIMLMMTMFCKIKRWPLALNRPDHYNKTYLNW